MDQDPNERTVVERRDPLVGATFDRRFQVDARIAAGGFGAIYRATHLKSGHEFALKILHANLTTDPRVVARFRREGATLTRLRDPHTITAYELNEAEDGTLYIVMELLHGESLYERFRVQGPMAWQRVFAIARAVCSSLAEAHALGVIHRDLKPTNIHLEQKNGTADWVKVLDFGIAKILHDGDFDASDLTHAGQMVGTLDYMSPEQMVGGQCTPASDIYTLGVVMYELIAGKKPFDDANSAAAALAAVLTTMPERLSSRAKLPSQAERVVMRCLERTSADRYQTAHELASALDDLIAATDEMVTAVAHPANTTLPGGTGAPKKHVTPAPKLIAPVQSSFVETLPLPRDTTPAPKLRHKPPTPQPMVAHHDLHEAPTVRRDPTPPVLTPEDLDKTQPDQATVVGHAPPVPPAPRRQIGTPRAGIPQVAPIASTPMPVAPMPVAPIPSTNLREAYPEIARAAPRAAPSPFDDRPPSSLSVTPFDMSRAMRRDTMIRRIAMAAGLAVAVLVLILMLAKC